MPYEVHPNRRDVALRVRVVRKPQQQAGLAHARVSDEQELEKVIVSGKSGISELPTTFT